MKKKKRFCAYPVIKVFSLLGMIVFLIIAAGGMAAGYVMEEEGVYSNTLKDTLDVHFADTARRNFYQVFSDLEIGEKDSAVGFLSDRNVAAMVISNAGNDSKFYYWRNESFKNNLPSTYVYSGFGKNDSITWTVYVDPDFPVKNDQYYEDYFLFTNAYKYRFLLIGAVALALILFIVFMVMFINGIGRVPDSDEVTENYFTKIPFDVMTLILASPALMCIWIAAESGGDEALVAAVALTPILVFLWLINAIHRIKLENVFRNTLIAKLCVLIFHGLKLLFTNLPLIWKAILILLGISAVELIGIIFTAGFLCDDFDAVLTVVLAWFFEKIIIIPMILYLVLMMKTLFKGGSELAAGNTEYRINVKPLIGEYRKHGEDLNNLSDGITKAVEERMKSERMKTELITNVSHDIKTPLTSIINYSDLIGRETKALSEDGVSVVLTEEEKAAHLSNITEYSDVLYRQSEKIRHLVEDLVEISKANSGNAEVNLENIEIGTMLAQAAGEYEERFEEKGLATVLSLPEEELRIMADRRKLWRIMDNLLQNIYKYSHPETRVFLSAEAVNGNVEITFRNTSAQLIDVKAEELLERFTRGEKSRHEEGNGLGLAIAKSLTEVQNGEFRIAVDGDLFKVVVIFKQSV